MAALGLLGAPLPQEYGGAGFDYITYLLICEEIAKASAGVFTTCLTVHTSLFQMPILRFGSKELKQRFLPRATKGEILGCFGMTETDSGSDVAGTEMSARPDGKNWILKGNKIWMDAAGDLTPELERLLDRVEEDIKNKRNIIGPFNGAKDANDYLDSL